MNPPMKTRFMISIETPGANAPGLFTGALAIDDAGYLLPGIIRREGEACAAIDAAWKAPTLVVADRVAGLLIETMHPGHTLTLIELHAAEEA